jgi:hypothetical protein
LAPEIELYTPTISTGCANDFMNARAASRLRILLNAKQSSPTSNSTAKRLARLVALFRLTKGVIGGFFTLDTRIAFGDGCDCPSYVAIMIGRGGICWQTINPAPINPANVIRTPTE